jgi:hypothetical protein
MTEIPFTTASDQKKVKFLSRLFSGFGSNFIFEVELHPPNPKPDFSCCIQKYEIPGINEQWQNENIKERLKNNELWHKVLLFCLECAMPDSRLRNHVDNVWFEFDHHQLSKKMPEPCLFISTRALSKKKMPEKSMDKNNQLDLNCIWLFREALGILLPEDLTVGLKTKFEECAVSLPPDGAIFQIGVLLARRLKHLRLCTMMPVKEYSGYLKKIHWPGNFDYLEPALQTFDRFADGIFLDLDVEEEVLPRVGIECYCSKKEDSIPKMALFFDLLCELGICSKNNANIIIDWLSKGDGNESFWSRDNLKRRLSHIKVTLEEDNTATAKAYMSLSRW